jgi:hypothetical protein
LPASYGTGRLLLTARDPRALYAHWDLSPEQQQACLAASAHDQLALRVHPGQTGSPAVSEIKVPRDARHQFIEVPRAGSTYVAELGYYQADNRWVAVVASVPVATPAGEVSPDTSVRFATFPSGEMGVQPVVPGGVSPGAAKVAFTPKVEWLPALDKSKARPSEPVQAGGQSEIAEHTIPSRTTQDLPPSETPQPQPYLEWTHERESALAEIVARANVGSGVLTQATMDEELGLGSGSGASIRAPLPLEAMETLSSPAGEARPGPAGFWFNINAELVIHGATEPDAVVTLGSRQIQLRPDGTFTLRFAFPDGRHTLPVTAVSARGDVRQAEFTFVRDTTSGGDVGRHPLPEPLPAPTAH